MATSRVWDILIWALRHGVFYPEVKVFMRTREYIAVLAQMCPLTYLVVCKRTLACTPSSGFVIMVEREWPGFRRG